MFDIELDDAPNMKIKLPYNLSDDPYMAAQRFIHKHELPQMFLDQIAQFIMKNTESATIDSVGGSTYYDPFTGGNRYVPGAGYQRPTAAAPAVADPFTGEYDATRRVESSGLCQIVHETLFVLMGSKVATWSRRTLGLYCHLEWVTSKIATVSRLLKI